MNDNSLYPQLKISVKTFRNKNLHTVLQSNQENKITKIHNKAFSSVH